MQPPKYDFLRPEKAEGFSLDQFISSLESIGDFEEQLELWNVYFNLPAMGRSISVEEGFNRQYHFYCESPRCQKGFTSEKQAILTNWRKNYFELLKTAFDQIVTYQERVDFKIKQFNTTLEVYEPESGIIFKTVPESSDERDFYNRRSYEFWEKGLIETPSFDANKKFDNRKEQFNIRIVRALHPEEELEKEIKVIRNEYDPPVEKWNKRSENENMHFKVFKDRLEGRMPDYPQDANWFPGVHAMFKFIEGRHAFEYYRYLDELKDNSNWLEEIRSLIMNKSKPFEVQKEIVSQKMLVNLPAILKSNYLYGFYIMFSKFFDYEDHEELNKLLKGEVINRRLLFIKNANQLIYVFWLAHKLEMLNEKNKVKLTEWISEAFKYKNNNKNEVIDFSIGYVDRLISMGGEDGPCKKPLREVSSYFDEIKNQ